jgi:hypothetical protein
VRNVVLVVEHAQCTLGRRDVLELYARQDPTVAVSAGDGGAAVAAYSISNQFGVMIVESGSMAL